MRCHRGICKAAAAALLLCFPSAELMAQRNGGRRVALNGHIHPKALPENDQGPVESSLTIPSVTLVLKQSAAQQAELDKLLAEQQDPSSPNYHRWLTPEEYADRFGASPDDVSKVVSWFEQQNLTATAIARGRNSVTLRGSAADVGRAFGTEFHRYQVDGRMHFANATAPSVPEPLDVIVTRIHGLNDFRLEPKRISLHPAYTSGRGNHYVAPNDLATIYNINPLYGAGIDGSGQKLVVVGQTQIDPSDIQQFRGYFSLPANDPQVILVPNLRDPGVSSDDLVEADLDLEWTGAVARNARIIYVYSFDVMDAVQYAIDQNLAPVLSMSYGLCEAETSFSDALTLQSWARQGNAQGMTWFSASGDSGGADCASGLSRSTIGLGVDVPSSIPEVTSVGGTEFSEGAGAYWNSSNDSNQASAVSYIPEIVWNDGTPGSPAASGGGASDFFLKPSWQTGKGVPNDGARSVPDVSLSASANHDGFLIYSGGSLQVVGGTSVSAPSFAGIATLLNHRLVSSGIQPSAGLGNMNPKLYSLAQTTPGAFHDITAGNNIATITCSARERNCVPGSYGYDAGPGYDRATGLGSVDAYSLVVAWTAASGSFTRGTSNMVLTSNASSILSADSVAITATVTSANGGTPTGAVTLYLGSASLGAATLAGAGGTATATVLVSGAKLPVGADTITAQYSGDTSYNGATASISITVTSPAPGFPSISGVVSAASFRPVYAPGMILSVFGAQLAPSTWSAAGVPLPMQLAGVSATINGVGAPLYYVSQGLLNIQIPYETSPNTTAVVTVNNNGQTASTSFAVAAAAPGIFTGLGGVLVPTKSAARGQIIPLFITGQGAVSPPIPTGWAPVSGTPITSLPKPLQTVNVTVGGVPAPVQFNGIPPGLVGVAQINFQVPAEASPGVQPVVVTVGGVSSAPASLTVQ